jgi:hypothetical protein
MKTARKSGAVVFFLVAACLVPGCHDEQDLFLMEWRLEPVSQEPPLVQKVNFILPEGLYACSFCLLVPEDLAPTGEFSVKLSYQVNLSDHAVETHLASKEVRLDAQVISEKLAETVWLTEFSNNQRNDILPFPWTHLSREPQHLRRAVWPVHPPFAVPENGRHGEVEFTIDFEGEVPKNLNQWIFRVERFIDAI